MKQHIDAARERVRAWFEARKAEAQAKREAKAQANLAHDHGHGRFFLLNVPVIATICAAVTEWYWAILFCIEATGHIDWNWETAFGSTQAASGEWNFAFSSHLPVLIGLLAATVPIVMLSMVWLPVQFAMRGTGRWRRGSIVAVGLLANILVIVSGTVVMNYNRQTQVREGLVVEQLAEQGRAGLVARRDAIQDRWETLTDSANTTLQAQAARAGIAGWDSYISTARQQSRDGTITPARLALIERARGSAVAAEEYQRQMDDLTAQIAAAPTQASVAANVTDNVGRELNTFAQYVEVWRPPFIALICTMIGIFGTWWVIAMLQQMDPRDVLRSGWAPPHMRIEDKRDEPKEPVQPYAPPRKRREVYNATTGEKEHWVEGHYRATGRKRKLASGLEAEEMIVQPEIPPDEVGVVGHATGTSKEVQLAHGAGVMLVKDEPKEEPSPPIADQEDAEPELSEEEAAELMAYADDSEAAIEIVVAGEQQDDNQEPDDDQGAHLQPLDEAEPHQFADDDEHKESESEGSENTPENVENDDTENGHVQPRALISAE